MSDSYFKLDAQRRAAIAASMPSAGEPLMEHTPTPWALGRNIVGSESVMDPTTQARIVTAHGSENAAANIAFIVRACNAHDELVAALKEIADDAWTFDYARTVAREALAKVQS